MPTRNISKYGWRRDLPDIHDLKYSLTFKPATPVPQKVDLRRFMPPIFDQGAIGACTANATVAMLEHNQIITGQTLVPLSRLFTYYNARKVEDATATDSGAMLRDVISATAEYGACPETDWPYDTTQFATTPTPTCYTDGANSKISVYARLNTLDDMLVCLASGHPFVFGITVYTSFESAAVAASGIVSLPASTEQSLGGHAICAVGYDQAAQTLLVRNSWGTGWGLPEAPGHFTLPFDYVTNSDLASDFWAVQV